MENNTELQKHVKDAINETKAAVTAKEVIVSINSVENDDKEIITEILNAFKWTQEIPDNKIKVTVENGWVTLQGEVLWNFQSAAAKNAVKNVEGVTGISNNIKVLAKAGDANEKADIEIALKRDLSVYDNSIRVDVAANKVTLTGKVNTEYQKNEAGRVAASIAGVCAIDNNLVVSEPGDRMNKQKEKII